MSYRDRFRHSNSTALFPHFSAMFAANPVSKLTTRTITIDDRREIEVKERKAGPPSGLFGASGPETTTTWSRERHVEIEEKYE
jgi:hypothetical protein